MKVAWVIPGIPAGGVSTVCVDATRAVAALTDHEVSLVAVHWCSRGFRAPEGVNLSVLGLPEDITAAAQGFDEWLHSNPQDVILMNDSSFLEPYWPYVPRETALVAAVHDDGRRYVRPVRVYHQHIDAVVAVSRYIAARIRRSMPSFDGILRTVHNGCNYPLVAQASAHPAQLRMLFVGRMDYFVKGVGDIPKILARLAQWGFSGSLTMIGGYDAALDRRCQETAPRIAVSWLGKLPHDECLRIAGCHDALLMTSRKESFGMVTVEAMAMGCVPIAYDIETGSREIIEKGVSGFLVPLGQYATFASKIAELDRDRKKLRAMANAAIQRARTAFSAERMGYDYASLFDEIVKIPECTRVRLPFAAFEAKPTRNYFYQRVPASFRQHIRGLIGRSTWLSYLVRRCQW